jgi:hypothetical protein
MKTCLNCCKLLPLSDFGNRTASGDGKQTRCKVCLYEYKKSWRMTPTVKNLTNSGMRRKSRAIKGWLLTELGMEECQNEGCDETHPACLDFHHLDSKIKSFKIAGKYGMKSKKILLEEAKKCKVLCANCHRKLHYRED